jgi:hypothetical protein
VRRFKIIKSLRSGNIIHFLNSRILGNFVFNFGYLVFGQTDFKIHADVYGILDGMDGIIGKDKNHGQGGKYHQRHSHYNSGCCGKPKIPPKIDETDFDYS